MAAIDGSEVQRRLRLMAEHIQKQGDLFEVVTPFTAGAGCDHDALASAEADAGIALPPDVREATLALAGTTWCWALRSELEEEWDADVAGANGGMIWLHPDEMKSARARLAAAEADLGSSLLPFAKDGGGDAAWLAIAHVKGKNVLVQVQGDGDTESWGLDDFLDSWSRAGFRIGNRWEDQPESVIEHLAEALDLPEEEWDAEDE